MKLDREQKEPMREQQGVFDYYIFYDGEQKAENYVIFNFKLFSKNIDWNKLNRISTAEQRNFAKTKSLANETARFYNLCIKSFETKKTNKHVKILDDLEESYLFVDLSKRENSATITWHGADGDGFLSSVTARLEAGKIECVWDGYSKIMHLIKGFEQDSRIER